MSKCECCDDEILDASGIFVNDGMQICTECDLYCYDTCGTCDKKMHLDQMDTSAIPFVCLECLSNVSTGDPV